MILFVSGRTDIIAFYSKWFIRRYEEGFVDVRNPFNYHLVSRINFSNVDLILFCTKNPWPIIDYLPNIKIPYVFHVTLTPYKKDIEENVPEKTKILKGIKRISNLIGPDAVYVRYDPILISDKYTIEYHKKAFSKLMQELNGYVRHVIVSFIDDYKNVRKNMDVLCYRELNREDYKEIGEFFSKSARDNGISVQTCFEDNDLVQYGFIREDCMSAELAYKLTGKKYQKWRARKENKCNCVAMADIGAYNTCSHFCKYCYANYDESLVKSNRAKHDVNSSLLIGNIDSNDVIKERK